MLAVVAARHVSPARADDSQARADAINQKLVDLRKAVGAAASPERVRELLTQVLALVDEALAADEYTAAIKSSAFAVETAAALDNEHISGVCARRKEEVAAIAKEAKKLTRQMEKLEKSPDDRVANFEVGRFRCVVRGDWERGLPLVAKGSNAQWAATAKRDLDSPAGADDQIAAGDEWGRLAAAEKSPRKSMIAERAVFWYRQVLKGSSAGDKRMQAVKALERLPILYVTDLDETEKTKVYDIINRYGVHGEGRPISVNGFKYPNSIGVHPPAGDEATVKFAINGGYKTFTAGMAINDLQLEFKDTVIFLVCGDGEVLWKSPPVKSRNMAVFCDVNVKGVKTLELKTRCPGGNYSAHAVWLDPVLLK
jgi:hypothetical protein